MPKNFMGKASAMKGPPKNAVGGGVPGAGSRGRINEAAGVKTKAEANAPKAGTPIGTAKATSLPVTSAQPSMVAGADSPYVMPAKHPAAKTTAVKGKVGW